MYRVEDTDTGRNKFVSRSKAVVLDNRDPLNRGRVVVEHPLLGQTVWIPYLRLPTIYDIPCIGDIVYLETEVGDAQFPIAWGNLGKQNQDGEDLAPDTFKREVPTNRGLFSPKGHLIELDDGLANDSSAKNDTDLSTDSRGLKFTSSGGHKVHLLDDDSNQILLEDNAGNSLIFDAANNKVSLVSKDIYDINVTGDKTELIGGSYIGKATVDFIMEAVKVKLGNEASFHAAIAENVIAYNDEHTHPSPQAPAGLLTTSVPSIPMSAKAGTALDPTALFIFIRGNA